MCFSVVFALASHFGTLNDHPPHPITKIKIEHNILVIYPFPLKRVCTIGNNRYDAYVLFMSHGCF